MKRFNKTNLLLKLLKPMATLILLFTLILNVHAQEISENSITAPAIVSAVGSLEPATIVGSEVKLIDAMGSNCSEIIYEWQSASDEFFQENLSKNLANTKDYKPSKITKTTYFRRVAFVKCDSGRANKSSTGGIKFTIN